MGRRALSSHQIYELLNELGGALGDFSPASPGSMPPGEPAEPLAQPHHSRRGVRLIEGDIADVSAEVRGETRRQPNAQSLIAILQQALDELGLHDEPAEGARFLLRLAHWAIHAESGWVLLLDPESKHFVVLAATGREAAGLEGRRVGTDDRLLAALAASRKPVIVHQPQDDPRTQSVRFLSLPARRSILCAPVTGNGHCLGAIELVDPVNFSDFAESHVQAAAVLASSFGRYLTERVDAYRDRTGPRRRRS